MQNFQIENNSTVSFTKKDEAVRVICFASQKQLELATLQQTKTAVRVSNYNKSLTGDIVLDNQTKLTPVGQIPFNYCETLTTTGVVPISSLPQVAAEQLVKVKVKVTDGSNVKTISTLHQRVLKK